MKRWKRLLQITLLIVGLLTIACSVILFPRTLRCYQHPTLPYQLVVKTYVWEDYFAFPGQGSDKACIIVLKNTASGATIARQNVAMLQLIETVDWRQNGVWINKLNGITFDGKRIGDW